MLLYDASYIIILHIHALASHLGTLDEPREGRDVRTESEDGVMVDLSQRWKDWTSARTKDAHQASVV